MTLLKLVNQFNKYDKICRNIKYSQLFIIIFIKPSIRQPQECTHPADKRSVLLPDLH